MQLLFDQQLMNFTSQPIAYLFMLNIYKMSRTAIDFFSRGLDANKTKLSVSVFDLNVKCEKKQSLFKKKASLSHISFNKVDKKQKVPEKDPEIRQEVQSWKEKKLASTMTSFPSTNATPIKRNLLKFEGESAFDEQISESSLKAHAQTTRQPRILKKLVSLNLHKLSNEGKNICKQIVRITEECEHHEESFNSSIEYHHIMGREDLVLEKINNGKEDHLDRNGQKQKRNYYFIRNLVLDNSQKKPIISHHPSQQKLTLRKLPPAVPNLRYLDTTKSTSLVTQRKQQIKLPNSLKACKISYFSCHDNPKKKKERSKKSILMPSKSKFKLLRKNFNQMEYQLGRWESHSREEVNNSGNGLEM